jgi:methylthioribose-1-phosphate isomerase
MDSSVQKVTHHMESPVVFPLKRNGNSLQLVDQRQLPHKVTHIEIENYHQLIEAIASLAVRGAPAIGFAGAYGVCLSVKESLNLPEAERHGFIQLAIKGLKSVRPTAVNLELMVNKVAVAIDDRIDEQLLQRLWQLADDLMHQDQQDSLQIGRWGAPLIQENGSYLTHCNAGGLATSGYGTALALFFQAHQEGRKFQVWVDETRPLLQGARITAWELMEAGISATLVTDSMAAHLMQTGRVDGVVVGADRIAANGDTANKIGTLGLAVLAQHFEIPLWIVAPEATIDRTIASGGDIEIEERSGDEIRQLADSWIAPREVEVYNPAFDVTPSALINGIITEQGIYEYPYSFSPIKDDR